MVLAGAVVVAQLAERSLPIPEIRGSNPNITSDKFVFEQNYLSIATQKRQIQRKIGREWPVFIKKYYDSLN